MTRRDLILSAAASAFALPALAEEAGSTAAGWRKYSGNPVIGGLLGTVFDISVLKQGDGYWLWGSWRPKKSIALFQSKDGEKWSSPEIALGPAATGWEDDINRPGVLRRDDGYHMWYTGQANGHSAIGYAKSPDGRQWTRVSAKPVLAPELPWEKVAVMCPQVLWDPKQDLFRMWYSGGEQYEPDAIGYATSPDGIRWRRGSNAPIFAAKPDIVWERQKVTAAQVVPHGECYYMFYIGFRDVDHAQIGIARSPDGVSNWERLPQNPIIRPTPNGWDGDACYKPSVVYDPALGKWMLWYNGRNGHFEQIGLATHQGEDLGFPPR
jgi:predicted GH43/DUF377 family glycosyl hydrolase